jgi:murein L,D-transpeptidase YcbB/YkuD
VLARPAFDPAPALDGVAAGDDVAAILAALAPRRPEYVRLRIALARYTQIAAAGVGKACQRASSPYGVMYAHADIPL